MTKTLVKRIDMALHVQELCANHKIKVIYQPLKDVTPRYYANQKTRTICIRPTKNTGFYVSALHEIGHIIGCNQSSQYDTLEKEIGAWKFAVAHSLVWTDTASRIMKRALMSYGVTEGQFEGIWTEICDYAKNFRTVKAFDALVEEVA
mgnify:FL=1|tara:strand:- start:157 stop:600 length:444 start_codon:yes stop_codon:yes gene_type:complete